ncbi:MAG TPA: hypothetical protein VJX67_20190, partial [Blastocatellia bacterium]|nr:hypothetical protein [Blastocatellia bacterium]
MDRFRFALAIILSAAVMILWPVAMHFLHLNQPPAEIQTAPIQLPPPVPAGSSASPSETGGVTGSTGIQTKAGAQVRDQGQAGTPTPEAAPLRATSAPNREITIETPLWRAKFTSEGAVLTSWNITEQQMPDGSLRPITGADGKPLELVPRKGDD